MSTSTVTLPEPSESPPSPRAVVDTPSRPDRWFARLTAGAGGGGFEQAAATTTAHNGTKAFI